MKTFSSTEVVLINTWKYGLVSNNTARIWKMGNCVSFNYDFCLNVDSNDRVQIATLEEKYNMPFLVTYYQPIASSTVSPYLQIMSTTVWCRSTSTTVRIMGFVTWASNR